MMFVGHTSHGLAAVLTLENIRKLKTLWFQLGALVPITTRTICPN